MAGNEVGRGQIPAVSHGKRSIAYIRKKQAPSRQGAPFPMGTVSGGDGPRFVNQLRGHMGHSKAVQWKLAWRAQVCLY